MFSLICKEKLLLHNIFDNWLLVIFLEDELVKPNNEQIWHIFQRFLKTIYAKIKWLFNLFKSDIQVSVWKMAIAYICMNKVDFVSIGEAAVADF